MNGETRRASEAFNFRELSILQYANGFTLWHYRTRATMADILGAASGDPNRFGYFGESDLLREGDRIMVSIDWVFPAAMDLLVIKTKAGEGVAVMAIGPVPEWIVP